MKNLILKCFCLITLLHLASCGKESALDSIPSAEEVQAAISSDPQPFGQEDLNNQMSYAQIKLPALHEIFVLPVERGGGVGEKIDQRVFNGNY